MVSEAYLDVRLSLGEDDSRPFRLSIDRFRWHLETTPTGYLRRVRLDLAHAELLAASPEDGLTVTAVAYRWGFLLAESLHRALPRRVRSLAERGAAPLKPRPGG